MDIVVKLGGIEGPRVKSDRVDFRVGSDDGKDGSEGVVGGICLNDELSVRSPISEDRSRGESFLQSFKRLFTVVRKVPRNAFPSEACKRNNDSGIVMNETTIEVGETKEGLDVLDGARFGPVANDFNLVVIHLETARRKDVTEILHGVLVKITFVGTSVKFVKAESAEDFANMFPMVFGVGGIDEDVVKVNDNADIEHV
jgi:hypothetical protein